MLTIIFGVVFVLVLLNVIRLFHRYQKERWAHKALHSKTFSELVRKVGVSNAESLLRACRAGYTFENLPHLRKILTEEGIDPEKIGTTWEELESLGRLVILEDWESLPRHPHCSEFRAREGTLPIEPPYSLSLLRALTWADGGMYRGENVEFNEETNKVFFSGDAERESDADFIRNHLVVTQWDMMRLPIPEEAMREWGQHPRWRDKIPQEIVRRLAGEEYRAGITVEWEGRRWVVATIQFGCRAQGEKLPEPGSVIREDFRLLEILLVDPRYISPEPEPSTD